MRRLFIDYNELENYEGKELIIIARIHVDSSGFLGYDDRYELHHQLNTLLPMELSVDEKIRLWKKSTALWWTVA